MGLGRLDGPESGHVTSHRGLKSSFGAYWQRLETLLDIWLFCKGKTHDSTTFATPKYQSPLRFIRHLKAIAIFFGS
jgi:hypothetical protein